VLTRRGRSWTAKTKTSAAVAASLLAVGVAACGGSSGTTAAPAAPQAPAGPAAPAAPAAAPAGPAAPAAPAVGKKSESAGKASSAASTAVPDYRPASVASKSAYSTVLTSPDSVSKIGSFYQGVLAKGGWQLRSSSNTAYSANFTAHRANEGVSISVYPRGGGSGISISTHPE
jgi:hypothetical protein